MPKTTRQGTARKSELPRTLQKSDAKARRTFTKAHDAAVEEYGEGERAHRMAYAALKHTHEKVGDHWEPKAAKGPSDRKAAGGRRSRARTAGGVDANASKTHLYDVAKRLEILGRSSMNKRQLVEAIQKENGRRTRASSARGR